MSKSNSKGKSFRIPFAWGCLLVCFWSWIEIGRDPSREGGPRGYEPGWVGPRYTSAIKMQHH